MKTISFVVDRNFPDWREKYAGVQKFAANMNWQVQVVNSNYDHKSISSLLKMLRSAGCIVGPSSRWKQLPAKLFAGLPVVYLDCEDDDVPPDAFTVRHDSAATVTPIVRDLVSKGLNHYAFVPCPVETGWNRERRECLERAARAAGGDFSCFKWAVAGHQKSHGLLVKFLKGLRKPCAILAANDEIASAVYLAAADAEITIGSDILLAGVDDNEFICLNVRPTLTSVKPNFERGGYLAAELLAAVMDGSADKRRLFYGPLQTCFRESTRRIMVDDPRVTRALTFIADHALDPEFRIAEVVAEMRCSRRLADMRFREATGHSILEEVHDVRFQNACKLLQNPRRAIGSIAALCGYTSDNFLKRMFKARTGLTMREWRKKEEMKSKK